MEKFLYAMDRRKNSRERRYLLPYKLPCAPSPASHGDGGAAAAYIKRIRPALSSRDAICCSLTL